MEEYSFVRRIVQADGSAVDNVPTEFATLDYTPCVAIRPVDMTERLRPSKSLRKVRMLICVTVYDETGDDLKRTLEGIAANLPGLFRAGMHWSELCVAVILDGRDRAHPSMLSFAQRSLRVRLPVLNDLS